MLDLNIYFFGNLPNLQPVSYTHLDVYKRQALVRDWGRIKPVRLQLPPTYQRLSVGHLEDPRTRGTLRPIEEFAPPVNVEEDLLNEIVSLSTVPERPLANGTDQPGVTPEKYSKSVLLSSGHHAYKRFIRCV